MKQQQFCNYPMLRDFSEDDNLLLLSALESGNQDHLSYGYQQGMNDGYQNFGQYYFQNTMFEPEVIYSTPQAFSQEYRAPQTFSNQEYVPSQQYSPQKYGAPQPYTPPQEFASPQYKQEFGSPQYKQEFTSTHSPSMTQDYSRKDFRQEQHSSHETQARSTDDWKCTPDYIIQLEQKCSKLEEENERISVENQFLRQQKEKPPLFRSFSKEMRVADKELDRIITRIRSESRRNGNEEQLRNLLSVFKQQIKSRQRVQSEETQQFAHPKLQERLSKLSKQNRVISHLRFDIRNLSQEQITEICALREIHLQTISDVFFDREKILSDIRNYYTEKIMGERVFSRLDMIESKDIGNDVILVLSNKIDSFKKNIELESKILLENLVILTQILTPSQEALIVLEYYNIHKENFSLYDLLSTIWDLFA